MSAEKLDKHESQYLGDDRYATQKDLKILSLEVGRDVLRTKMELKDDISSVKTELNSEILKLRNELKSDIHSLELNIEKKINKGVYKLGGFILTLFGLLTWWLPHLIK